MARKQEKTARTVICRSFPRAVDIVAWLVQRRLAYRGKFQKFFNDRRQIVSNLGYSTSFPATKNNSIEIAYISYKKIRYTFDKSAEKINGRVLVTTPQVKACDFLGFVEYFFSQTSRCTGQATRSIDKENYFV